MASPGRRSPRPTRPATRLAPVGALVLGLLLSACSLPRFGAPDSASDEGDRVVSLWSGFFVVAVLVAGLVWALLIFVILRYRRGDDDTIPSQRAYNIPLEIVYTVIPVLIVAVLFFFSVRTEEQVTAVSSDPAVRVEVVGFQWGWQFRYLDEGFTIDAPPGEKPQLVIPIDAATNLQLVSTDVNHSFWVPDFLSKRDLIPGVDNEITVSPHRAGTYEGRCAEFCGLDHWRMAFTVKVVSADEYAAWAAEQQAAGGRASSAPSTDSSTEGAASTGVGG